MQFSYLHFKHPYFLCTLSELSRSNFFLESITPKTSGSGYLELVTWARRPRWKSQFEKNLTAKVHLKCVKCGGVWNANTRIAFLFSDTFCAFYVLSYNTIFSIKALLHQIFAHSKGCHSKMLITSYITLIHPTATRPGRCTKSKLFYKKKYIGQRHPKMPRLSQFPRSWICMNRHSRVNPGDIPQKDIINNINA